MIAERNLHDERNEEQMHLLPNGTAYVEEDNLLPAEVRMEELLRKLREKGVTDEEIAYLFSEDDAPAPTLH